MNPTVEDNKRTADVVDGPPTGAGDGETSRPSGGE